MELDEDAAAADSDASFSRTASVNRLLYTVCNTTQQTVILLISQSLIVHSLQYNTTEIFITSASQTDTFHYCDSMVLLARSSHGESSLRSWKF